MLNYILQICINLVSCFHICLDWISWLTLLAIKATIQNILEVWKSKGNENEDAHFQNMGYLASFTNVDYDHRLKMLYILLLV